jgi:hypothetical protein
MKVITFLGRSILASAFLLSGCATSEFREIYRSCEPSALQAYPERLIEVEATDFYPLYDKKGNLVAMMPYTYTFKADQNSDARRDFTQRCAYFECNKKYGNKDCKK